MAFSKRRPVLVADVVARFLSSRHEHPDRVREATAMKVFGAFMRIGSPLIDHAEPAMFKHGVLTLTVGDSAWLTELTFLRPEVLKRLNAGFQRPVVRDIRMRLGRLSRRAPATPLRAPALTSEQTEKVDAWASEIESTEVREAMVRAASKSLTGPKKRAPASGPPGPFFSSTHREVGSEAPSGRPRARTGPSDGGDLGEPRRPWPEHRDRWRTKSARGKRRDD